MNLLGAVNKSIFKQAGLARVDRRIAGSFTLRLTKEIKNRP